jgi:hypothetical protein
MYNIQMLGQYVQMSNKMSDTSDVWKSLPSGSVQQCGDLTFVASVRYLCNVWGTQVIDAAKNIKFPGTQTSVLQRNHIPNMLGMEPKFTTYPSNAIVSWFHPSPVQVPRNVELSIQTADDIRHGNPFSDIFDISTRSDPVQMNNIVFHGPEKDTIQWVGLAKLIFSE